MHKPDSDEPHNAMQAPARLDRCQRNLALNAGVCLFRFFFVISLLNRTLLEQDLHLSYLRNSQTTSALERLALSGRKFDVMQLPIVHSGTLKPVVHSSMFDAQAFFELCANPFLRYLTFTLFSPFSPVFQTTPALFFFLILAPSISTNSLLAVHVIAQASAGNDEL